MKVFRRVVMELPPRTRRIPRVGVVSTGAVGTTSAYAENTAARQQQLGSVRNYLRVRGEYGYAVLPP